MWTKNFNVYLVEVELDRLQFIPVVPNPKVEPR